MRLKGWMLGTMLLALVPLALQAAPSDQTKWSLNSFTWVHRVPAEPGAEPNAHPLSLDAEALQTLLLPVQAQVEGAFVPLFDKDEVKSLAKALSEAFALAKPSEDLVLLATSRRGGGFLTRAEGVTARLFVRDGALNLILHEARSGFMDRYLVEHVQPKFTYGSRLLGSKETIQAPQARRLRGDWLALPLVADAPAVVLAPVPQTPAPVPAQAPAPVVRDAAFFEAQTLRLQALKRLRDQNLLSEAEYQEKRDAILKTL
jgi:hypothetical protein